MEIRKLSYYPINLTSYYPKLTVFIFLQIPHRSVKKGGAFGFVEFPSVALAKAAFDAAKGLKIDGNPATVRSVRTVLPDGKI